MVSIYRIVPHFSTLYVRYDEASGGCYKVNLIKLYFKSATSSGVADFYLYLCQVKKTTI